MSVVNEPELIADCACTLGEGPMWHPDEGRLYWTDIDSRRLIRYDPETRDHEPIAMDQKVGGFTLQSDGSLLLFMDRGSVRAWKDGVLTTIIEHLPDEIETRFNDVIADPVGRVFCGTMPTRERRGRLYRMEHDGSITLLLEGIGCSNGMGFTPDGKSMYYTDTGKREIYLFDYAVETGSLSNQRVFASFHEGIGYPDGMTVDADGYVWTALWDGGSVVRLAPDGREIDRVALPAKKCTCITFGGPEYTDMYITTAGGDRKDRDGAGAGALFRLQDQRYKGVPEFRSRIGL